MTFDFSGLAALLAVPVSLAVGLLSARRSRGLEDRINRLMDLIDRMPKESAEREALEDARDHLAFRLAERTFNPVGWIPPVGAVLIGIIYAAIALVWKTAEPDDRGFTWTFTLIFFIIGVVNVILGILLGVLSLIQRRRYSRAFKIELAKRADYLALSRLGRWRFDRSERRSDAAAIGEQRAKPTGKSGEAVELPKAPR